VAPGLPLPPVPDPGIEEPPAGGTGPAGSRGPVEGPAPPTPIWSRRRGWVGSPAVNALLFALTAGSVYLVGGPLLAAGLLSILTAHEMGHYLLCRRYRVDATLPYFIPFPVFPFTLVGTLGAFIRIRGPIPHRRALFDIGIGGPLAGFAVCVPVMVLGIYEARIIADVPAVPGTFSISLGEPLLFHWAAVWLRSLGADQTLSIGPLGLAAWFGLLVTALNMMPIGQLDGGHVVYSMLRGRAHLVSRIASWVCVALIYFGPSWILWAILVRLLGRRHPPTWDDSVPLGRARVAIGIFGFVMFALCFTPTPIVTSWSEYGRAFQDLLRWLGR
jgi:membrane-associated protease RseP (regulator of RpoE activity)